MVETVFDHYANCEFEFVFLMMKILSTLINFFCSFCPYYPQVQFLIVFCHTIQIQFQPNCNFPKFIGMLLTLNAALFTYMFSSFYIKSYNKKAKEMVDEKKIVYDENSNEVPNDKAIKAE